MSDLIIYHNGECSKCRGALELLIQNAIPHTVRWYLADPLSKDELIVLLRKLNMKPSELIRHSEQLYKEKYQHINITEDEWLDVLVLKPEFNTAANS